MTLINQNSILKRGLCLFLVMAAALSLSACGGNKKVSTKDDSADYRSAKALPPLKKPSRVVVKQQSVNQQAATVEVIKDDYDLVSQELNGVAVEGSNSSDSIPASATIDSNVVTGNSGEVRLEVAADFEQTWDYLSASLQKSDLTVFSRNKGAGRFSIGCANIAAAPTVSTSGRWSFFNRSKKQNLEHCALQAVEKRGSTIVSVLNRAGEEVSGEYSSDVFNRILKN